MGYLINSTTLLALGGSKSTRVKCLHELEVVLNNNITFNNVENDPSELQVVNFPCLIKKLILWFNLEDDSEELNVLKLILKLVKV